MADSRRGEEPEKCCCRSSKSTSAFLGRVNSRAITPGNVRRLRLSVTTKRCTLLCSMNKGAESSLMNLA